MNVLDKIKKLKKEKGWTNYKLSLEAGLTQSTVTNMFYRNTCPSIATLEQICSAFGITLSEFFSENSEPMFLTNKERELLNNFRLLNSKEKSAIENVVKTLAGK